MTPAEIDRCEDLSNLLYWIELTEASISNPYIQGQNRLELIAKHALLKYRVDVLVEEEFDNYHPENFHD